MSNRHPKPPVRPHTEAQILHAVARMLTTPQPGGIGLAVPEEIRNLVRHTPATPARLILPSRNNIRHIRRWADALELVISIKATASAYGDGDMQLAVVGRIRRGPVVSIEAWVQEFPISLIPEDQREMTLAELHALDGGL